MTKEELEKLMQAGENDRVEFKSNAIPPNNLSRYIVAFANANGGTIYFGISEIDGIVGCNKERLTSSFELAMKRIHGDINTDLQFKNIDSLAIGVLTIEKAKTLVSSTEGVFIRSGERLRAMMPQEIQKLLSLETKDYQMKILTEMVSNQTNYIEKLNSTIEKLQKSIDDGNKFSKKLKDYIVGGIVGALISIIIGAIIVL